MGEVLQALSPEGETVALKTVLWPQGLDARSRWETVERFQREARAARSLAHPNICQVLDIGAEEDTFFIVMEFLDGQTVAELIQLAGAVKAERCVEIMLGACGALAFAHEQGIVHRDIKPANIMILRNGQVKLTDFGLASIVHEAGVTQTGTTMGTFAYMSPEQTRGEKLDARSDIFSLGSTFYEMLSGHRPFQGEGPGVIVNQILTKDPATLEGIPSHISLTVNKCMRKQPEHRFQSVTEILDRLRQPAQAQASSSETAILPGGPPGSVYASPPVTQIAKRVAQQPPAPAETSAVSGRPPDLRCTKCNEAMTKTTPSCWRCGTPNPLISQRKHREDHGKELRAALSDLAPRKKRGWLKRGR